MFGYITVNKPELKIREYARYRGWYCGLCHVLQHRHGLSGQLTLTYDMTFLVILLSSLYEPKATEEMLRCPVHPLNKQLSISNRITEYAADMNVLLAWYKCADDLADEGSMKGLAAMRLLDKNQRTVRDSYPEKSRQIRQYLSRLSAYERRDIRNPDLMAGCFGKLLAVLFDYTPENSPLQWQKTLRSFGFFLGKYIYMLDACLDLEEDLQKGRYNPLRSLSAEMTSEELEALCRRMLELTMGQACRHFERLPLVEDAELMRNILYAGVWMKYENRKDKL